MLLFDEFAQWHKKWQARNPKLAVMKAHNPAVIPRNHYVEEALSAAGEGDYSVIHKLLAALESPYAESDVYSGPPMACSCGYKTFCGT